MEERAFRYRVIGIGVGIDGADRLARRRASCLSRVATVRAISIPLTQGSGVLVRSALFAPGQASWYTSASVWRIRLAA